jgi:hypothetical protein
MRYVPEQSDFSIVLVGTLNPAIFSPGWMSAFKLIPANLIENANVEMIHPEIAKFDVGPFEFTIQRERYQIRTRQADEEIPALDITCRIFRELLPHTPLFATGINHSGHFKLAGFGQLNRLGDAIAPKAPWGVWGQRLNERPEIPGEPSASLLAGPFLRRGGLRTITMEQSVRDDGRRGFIRVTVQPSAKVEYGAYININNHMEIPNREQVQGSAELLSILEQGLDDARIFAVDTMDHLVSLAETE